MILLAIHVYAVIATQTSKGPSMRAGSRAEVASVRRFVQRFYDWYTPKVFGANDAEHLALVKKPAVFSPEFRRALQDDWQAQHDWNAQGQDGIVGIDWDPFLSGQDPAKRYWVRKIDHEGQTWLVSVWSSYGELTHKPDVVAKVEKGPHGWRFVDFFYPEEKGSKFDSLLDSLRLLKKDREHAK